jgi:hypothetical protein
VLGLSEDLDIEEVTMTLSDDGTRKTVILGRERTPVIRVVLSEPNEEPLPDDQFVRYSLREARQLIDGLNDQHPHE